MSPLGDELVLAAVRGRTVRGRRQRARFAMGEVFAGRVTRGDEPVLSADPRQQPFGVARSRRGEVPCSVWVPLPGESGPTGSLHVAWRRRPKVLSPHAPQLTHAAAELGRTIQAARLAAADPLIGLSFDSSKDAGANLRAVADLALQTLVRAAGADSGTLSLLDAESRLLETVAEDPIPSGAGPSLGGRAHPADECPAVIRNHCSMRPNRDDPGSPACCDPLRDAGMTICLPLRLRDSLIGLVRLGYGQRDPLPTRRLSLLHIALRCAAAALHNARVAVHQESAVHRTITLWRASPGAAGEAPASPGAATNYLDLRCLGQFEILRDGLPVRAERFSRRRSLSLLKILLTRYGQEIHREELMELLWPDVPRRSANPLLNVAAHYLRRALEPQVGAHQPSRFIRTNGDYYAFDVDSPHRLDTHEFRRAVQAGDRYAQAKQPAQAMAAYERALSLYRGEFLAEELYSDWCVVERENLRQLLLRAARSAATLYCDRGLWQEAIEQYRRVLQVDPSQEEIHRALMETLWRAGRRDEALRQYQACRRALARELDVEPMPETERLRQLILSSDHVFAGGTDSLALGSVTPRGEKPR